MLIGGISLLMNGRIVFPLVAMAWLLLLIVRWWFGFHCTVLAKFRSIVISLWLSSVSSGTFSVVYIMLIYWLAELVFHVVKRQTISNVNINLLCLLLILISSLLLPFLIFLQKNLSYYGADLSSIWQLLQHGFGTVFF